MFWQVNCSSLSFRSLMMISKKPYFGTMYLVDLVHVPIFGGLSGSEDRGGSDNSIQFINIGRVGDKSFKE